MLLIGIMLSLKFSSTIWFTILPYRQIMQLNSIYTPCTFSKLIVNIYVNDLKTSCLKNQKKNKGHLESLRFH
ncbi:hypothetical protein AEQU3_02754 [Aequorivita antarctica]|nr:hypothetical protein AEQU3_02754 [Aequorivita antarctica]